MWGVGCGGLMDQHVLTRAQAVCISIEFAYQLQVSGGDDGQGKSSVSADSS